MPKEKISETRVVFSGFRMLSSQAAEGADSKAQDNGSVDTDPIPLPVVKTDAELDCINGHHPSEGAVTVFGIRGNIARSEMLHTSQIKRFRADFIGAVGRRDEVLLEGSTR